MHQHLENGDRMTLKQLRQVAAFCRSFSLAFLSEDDDRIDQVDDIANLFDPQEQVVGWSLAEICNRCGLECEEVHVSQCTERVFVLRRAAIESPDEKSQTGLSSQLLAHAEQLSELGCFEWDILTNHITWSDGLYRIYGVEPQSFKATLEGFLAYVLPEDRAVVMTAVQKAIEQRGSFENCERIQRASGEIRVLESRGHVICNASGQPVKLIGVCRDVTRRTRYQDSLAWQIKGLQLLAESASEHMARYDDQAWHQFFTRVANHLGCEAFACYGYCDSKLYLRYVDGFPPEAVAALQVLEHGQMLCGCCAAEGKLLYVDNNEISRHPQAQLLYQGGFTAFIGIPLIYEGQLLGVVSFVSRSRSSFADPELDFSQTVGQIVASFKLQRRFEDQMRRADETSRLILQHAKLVLWEADLETLQFRFLAGPYEELLGYDKSSWLAPGFLLERLKPDFCGNICGLFLNSADETLPLEVQLVRADHEEIWVEVIVQYVCDQATGERLALRGVMSDITTRKLIEEHHRSSLKMEAVGRLASGVAHDFNNLLTVINTYAELIELTAGSDVVIDHAKAIRDAASRANRLTTQLLMFGRKSPPSQQVIDLNSVLQRSEDILQRILHAGIVLRMTLQPNLPRIRFDEGHLDQVLLNLCVNARDAMENGGQLSISTDAVRLGASDAAVLRIEPGIYVTLTVTDTGKGMPDETRLRAFEPFFTTKPVGQGTGLGLAVVYGVIIEAGGAVTIDSDLGKGTSFRVYIPTATTAEVASVVTAY